MRASARGPIHARAVPFLNGGERPVGGLISVATIAGVGNSELLRQQRIGNGESVVVTRMALHVGGDRHVAVGAGWGMGKWSSEVLENCKVGVMTVRRRINPGSGRDGRSVAGEAKAIPREPCLA